jgi:hypothetical protein
MVLLWLSISKLWYYYLRSSTHNQMPSNEYAISSRMVSRPLAYPLAAETRRPNN